MGKKYMKFVDGQAPGWSSISNILDFEGDRDLQNEPDKELVDDALHLMRAMRDETLETIRQLEGLQNELV